MGEICWRSKIYGVRCPRPVNKIIVERSTVDIFDRATVSVFSFAE